ncbi:MAG: plasmid mobilization protein [Candidatus Humimicrobiaceae bacterium]
MSRKRNNSLGIWLTQEELEDLKTKISKTNLNQNAYIRKCILEKNITVIPGVRDLIIEIKRIGNNLNQITRLANEGSLTILGDNVKNIKDDLKSVWEKLAETLRKI